jgi:hypothetical protein
MPEGYDTVGHILAVFITLLSNGFIPLQRIKSLGYTVVIYQFMDLQCDGHVFLFILDVPTAGDRDQQA